MIFSSENQEKRPTWSLSSSIMRRLAQRQTQETSSSTAFTEQQQNASIHPSSSSAHQQQHQQQQVHHQHHPAPESCNSNSLKSRLMSLSTFQPPLPGNLSLFPALTTTQVRVISTSITPELPCRHQRGKREASVGRRTGEEILGTKKFTSTGLSAGGNRRFYKIF